MPQAYSPAAALPAILCLQFSPPQAAAQTTTLGTTNTVEGPAAGTDSVVRGVTPAGQPWNATANAPWLHLDAANQGGTGGTNVVFTFDANPGATRTGTPTIAGQTLTVTQAGANYVPANPFTTLVAAGLYGPTGVAVGSDPLPASANLTWPGFAPVSDSPWLTITGVAEGVVSFAFTANPSATHIRTAHLASSAKPFPSTRRTPGGSLPC